MGEGLPTFPTGRGELEGQHSHLRPGLGVSVLLCAPYFMTQCPRTTASPVGWGSDGLAPCQLLAHFQDRHCLLHQPPTSPAPSELVVRRSIFLPGWRYKPLFDNQL